MGEALSATLSSEHRTRAHQLWADLVGAPTSTDLEKACEALKMADSEVRGAIIEAHLPFWRSGTYPTVEENPFA